MKRQRIIGLTYASLSVNFAYAVYNGVIGLANHTWWFITLCIYYALLSVMRFALLRTRGRAAGDISVESFAGRFTGIFLVILSVSLVGTVILSFVTDRGTRYHEIVIITVALYSFIKVTLGIINLVRAKRFDSPVITALRNISLADAFVSIFALQRSMLVSFEGMSAGGIKLMNILTGSAVCIAVLILGINLIAGRRTIMAKSKLAKANKKIAEKVVGGYKKVEDTVVGDYTKVEDKFVDAFLTKDGETVEEAKERLKNNNK